MRGGGPDCIQNGDGGAVCLFDAGGGQDGLGVDAGVGDDAACVQHLIGAQAVGQGIPNENGVIEVAFLHGFAFRDGCTQIGVDGRFRLGGFFGRDFGGFLCGSGKRAAFRLGGAFL